MRTKKIVLAGIFVAGGLLLPFLTGQLQIIGSMLLPMHIPVLLCGFVCGWPAGIIVGSLTPLLRGLLLGMPPLLPIGAAMAFELAAYGGTAGVLYSRYLSQSRGRLADIYITLLLSMAAGRIVWGGAAYFFYRMSGIPFTLEVFAAGAFLKAIPGIVLQLIVVPPLVILINKTLAREGV